MHSRWMAAAYKEALKARDKDEVPVGAVIVHNGKAIARAHNVRESKQAATGHAEIMAIAKACRKLGSWRLEECDVYVTLEPCPMCAGALQQARVRHVYYGAHDLKGGAVSLGFNIHEHPALNHRYKMDYVESPHCSKVLSDFFKAKRARR